MRKATIEEMRKIQLEMLETVDKICRQNYLVYYIAYGSLIGVIRHKGFIPWDDDIDLVMMREDYEKFIEIFQHSKFELRSPIKTKNYPYSYAKMRYNNSVQYELIENKQYDIGINIDIFPLDGIPNKGNFLKRIYSKILLIKSINLSKDRGFVKNMFLKITNIIFKPIPVSYLAKKMDQYAKNPTANCSQVACQVGTWANEPVMEKKDFKETIDMPFEHLTVLVPKGYDRLLTRSYGDYMQLPPEDQRYTHHMYESYLID